MKHLSTTLVLLAGLALAWVVQRTDGPDYAAPGGASGVPRALPAALPAQQEVETFAVTGMCCDGCPTKLYARLLEVPGVTFAAVDREAGRAQVAVEPGTDGEALLSALTFDDYAAVPLP
jgi:copper chaperone CopZ